MPTKIKTNITIILIILLFVGGLWSGYKWGHRKGIDIISSKDVCKYLGGEVVEKILFNKEYRYCEVEVKEKKLVFILEEEQRCKKWRGELFARGKIDDDSRIDDELIIKCTKSYTQDNKEITETLFDYKF